MTQVRFPSAVLAAIFFPSAGPPAAAIFLHLCWSFCCAKNNRVEREEARSAKTSSAQTREKELGRCFFSKFFTTAQENVKMG